MVKFRNNVKRSLINEWSQLMSGPNFKLDLLDILTCIYKYKIFNYIVHSTFIHILWATPNTRKPGKCSLD